MGFESGASLRAPISEKIPQIPPMTHCLLLLLLDIHLYNFVLQIAQ